MKQIGMMVANALLLMAAIPLGAATAYMAFLCLQ